MVQGTMSNAGKSLVAAALCRIFRQDGYRVCPFKSQNMALNSFITEEGLEMGRAQVMQAEAAGIKPSVRMNPILLKPNSDTGSQVIVNGEVRGNLSAVEYYRNKRQLIPEVMKSYEELANEYDIIVIEGAGSPAEINLKENDIVNMGMAKLADAPVLLVGDIDRGGVFAQLYGTVKLLEPEEQERIKGLVINKFRGDASILDPGLDVLEDLTGIPVTGVLPYMTLDIDDEDSLSERLHGGTEIQDVDIAVIRLPRMSNFTDFAVFEQMERVSVRYVTEVRQLRNPDLILIPGSKSTLSDLLWMRQNGLEAAVQKASDRGTIVFGICGGYQMLGMSVTDADEIEGGGSIPGMGLLPTETVLLEEKHRTQLTGEFCEIGGPLAKLKGITFEGYEIHHGRTILQEGEQAMSVLADGNTDGAWKGNVYGSYIHGIFDRQEVAEGIIRILLERKGLDADDLETMDRQAYKERQYDLLARSARTHMDIPAIYRMMGLEGDRK
jgi:adenosylcobyric acid synthase